LVIKKRLAAPRLDRFQPGGEQRPVWHRERQLGDDDVRQRVARHVHPLPEAIDAEQDRIASAAKALEHLMAWHAVALTDELQALVEEDRTQARRRSLHHLIAGE
jgi:hypothetical protein